MTLMPTDGDAHHARPELQLHFAVIDRAIEEARVPSLPAIIAALAARISVAAARMMSLAGEVPDRADSLAENLSVDAAARRLGVSPAWLYKNASRLPFTVRIGRRLLFSAAGLERWNRQRQGG